MVRNIIFDFGKVLVDYDFEHVMNTYTDDKEDLWNFAQTVLTWEFIDECDKEDIPFEEIIRNRQKLYPQWAGYLQKFHDFYFDFVTGEIPGMRDLLLRLRARGYRLYGLTNWCHIVHQVIEHYDILQLLDDRIISSEEHLIKPDIAIYRRLCDKFSLKAEECLFTDDKQVNVDGARAAGMQAILFRDAGQFAREMEPFLRMTDEADAVIGDNDFQEPSMSTGPMRPEGDSVMPDVDSPR